MINGGSFCHDTLALGSIMRRRPSSFFHSFFFFPPAHPPAYWLSLAFPSLSLSLASRREVLPVRRRSFSSSSFLSSFVFSPPCMPIFRPTASNNARARALSRPLPPLPSPPRPSLPAAQTMGPYGPFIPLFSAHLDIAHRLIIQCCKRACKRARARACVRARARARGPKRSRSFYSCDRYYYVVGLPSAQNQF